MAAYKASPGFLRTLFFSFGLLLGFWLMATFSAWISETWNLGDAGMLFIPLATLLFGIVYIIALSIITFKPLNTDTAFFKRMAVFFSTSLVMSMIFLTFAGKLFWIPIFRITNAPVSVFDRLTLEKKLGFKPLLPTQPFPGLEASWIRISQGNLGLNFKHGAGTLEVSQATDASTSSVVKWCGEMQRDTERFVSTPVVIAQQESFLYYPKSIERDVSSSYCVPLTDRVIYISPGYGRSVGSVETLKFWLENLE
jgi:hypothetical protein